MFVRADPISISEKEREDDDRRCRRRRRPVFRGAVTTSDLPYIKGNLAR